MRPATLGILGIGAFARALAHRARQGGVATVLGWTPMPRDRVASVRDGIVDDAPARPEEMLARCDVVVLAGDAAQNLDWLERFGPCIAPGRYLTDVGMTKRAIVARAGDLGLGDRFAGSRPVLEPSARWDGGVVVYVTPAGTGDEAAREVAHFWESVCGAHPVLLDAERHDAQVALSAQLPALVAVALAAVLESRLPPGVGLSGAAQDFTRLPCDGDLVHVSALWQNRDHGAAVLRDAAAAVERLAASLEAAGPADFAAALAAAQAWRRSLEP